MWSSVLAGTLCEVRWQMQLRHLHPFTRRGWSGTALSASHAGASRGRARGPHDGVTRRGGPRRGGLRASIALSRSRPSEADTRGSRARDALDGHKEGTSVLINDEPVWW